LGRLFFYIYIMKTLAIAFTCILYSEISRAQKDSLSFDEHNKYIYYQVVKESALNADTLYIRALSFLKKAYSKNKLKLVNEDKAQGALTGKGVFLVTKKALVLNHEDGEVTYSLKIEVKDSKYRYWLSDLVYTPYQRNRYGSFEPTPGINIPLEHAKDKIDQKDLKEYLNRITLNSREIGANLKLYMENASSASKEVKTRSISTKDW